MTLKALYCSDRACGQRYHQDVDASAYFDIDPCPRCHAAGVMIVNPEYRLVSDASPRPAVKYSWLTNHRVVKDSLAGDTESLKTLCGSYLHHGYRPVGYHGCSVAAATNIMQCGVDKAKNVAAGRGKGFYIGSKHDGIPLAWSRRHADPIVLHVFLRDFDTMVYGVDYDWGAMDEDHEPVEHGLEMVIYDSAFDRIRVMPAISRSTAMVWDRCPTDFWTARQRRIIDAKAKKWGRSFATVHRSIMDGSLEAEKSQELDKAMTA